MAAAQIYTPCAKGLICLNKICTDRLMLNLNPVYADDEDDDFEVVVVETETSSDDTDYEDDDVSDEAETSELDAENSNSAADYDDGETQREVFPWGYDPYVKQSETTAKFVVGPNGEKIPYEDLGY